MRFQLAVGESFAVHGRRDLVTVAQIIDSRDSELAGGSSYLVESLAGVRWLLRENEAPDGPRWIGRAVPADTLHP